MAISIHDTPNNYTPSGNPVKWTFSSDQTAQPNFSYLVEVYVNAVLQGREQIFPDNGINGRIDVTSYAERFTNPPVLSTDLSADAVTTVGMNITVIERFGDPIADGASGSSSSIRVFKAKLKEKPFVLFDPADFLLTTNGVKFLTLFPVDTDNMRCRDNEQLKLLLLSDLNCDELDIDLFELDGTPVADVSEAVVSARTVTFNVGIASLIANTALTQANFDASFYYEVKAKDTIGGNDTVPLRIDIDRRCVRDTHKRVHFLSTIGSIDAFTYALYSNESAKVGSFSMEREFGSWDGNSFVYDFQSGTKIDFQKTAEIELKLRADWLSEGEQNWLSQELTLSPIVYIEDPEEAGLGLVRVGLKKSTYRLQTTKQHMLFRQDIDLVIESFTSMSV